MVGPTVLAFFLSDIFNGLPCSNAALWGTSRVKWSARIGVGTRCGGGSPKHRHPEKSKQPTPSASRPRWLRASESRGYMWRWFSETPGIQKNQSNQTPSRKPTATRSAPRRVAATCGGGSPKHRHPDKSKQPNSFRKPTAMAPRLGESRLHVEVVLRNTGIQKNQSNQLLPRTQ